LARQAAMMSLTVKLDEAVTVIAVRNE